MADKKYTTEQRLLQGNPSNERLPAPIDPDVQFPDVLEDVPAAPEWLEGVHGDTGSLAVRAWNSIAPVLVNARQFREGDQVALARYCRYVAEWVELTNDIDIRGAIIEQTSAKGGESTIANPAYRARGLVETAMSALEKELGLSPRARVEVQKRLMAALQNLPINGNASAKSSKNGPIGALNSDDEDDE